MEQFVHECAGLMNAQQDLEGGAPSWRNGHFWLPYQFQCAGRGSGGSML